MKNLIDSPIHQYTAALSGVAMLALATASMSQLARADVIYNEALLGDLSDSGLAPTPLTVATGQNQVLGAFGVGAQGIDRDYFTFSVPPGLAITSIVVLPNTVTGGGVSFVGVQAGSQVTVSPSSGNATGLLGWKHFNAANGNILTDLSIPAAGSTGFVPPLGPGSYSFWVQETSPGPHSYGLDFGLDAISTTVPDLGGGLGQSAALIGVLLLIGRSPARQRG